MREIFFKNNKLQKQGRVKIPPPIIDTLGLIEGQQINIILDTEDECIIIRKKVKNKSGARK